MTRRLHLSLTFLALLVALAVGAVMSADGPRVDDRVTPATVSCPVPAVIEEES